MLRDNRRKRTVNNALCKEYLGWYFDYDRELDSFFISIFNSNNFNEELIFLIDFDKKEKVTRGIRFRKDGDYRNIRKNHKIFEEAREVATFIKSNFNIAS